MTKTAPKDEHGFLITSTHSSFPYTRWAAAPGKRDEAFGIYDRVLARVRRQRVIGILTTLVAAAVAIAITIGTGLLDAGSLIPLIVFSLACAMLIGIVLLDWTAEEARRTVRDKYGHIIRNAERCNAYRFGYTLTETEIWGALDLIDEYDELRAAIRRDELSVPEWNLSPTGLQARVYARDAVTALNARIAAVLDGSEALNPTEGPTS